MLPQDSVRSGIDELPVQVRYGMTIGLIGSGNIGTALARLSVEQGHDVVLSNSRGPETLADLVTELGPKARAGTAAEAAQAGDIVVVTVPFGRYREVPAGPLAGKIVIDTNNYYVQRDGEFPQIDAGEITEPELLAEHAPGARVVRAFNGIQSAHLLEHRAPAGDPNRRALPIAGDDAEAKRVVAGLIDSFGFDVVDVGPLSASAKFRNGTPAYGPRATVAELNDLLAKA
jgi:8-hydroxy-5-deazaflavin:NADPH oxidoreductase